MKDIILVYEDTIVVNTWVLSQCPNFNWRNTKRMYKKHPPTHNGKKNQ